jgi:hypothetical protein
VLNPKMLPVVVDREPARLGPEDIQLIASHVSQYLGSGERNPSRR